MWEGSCSAKNTPFPHSCTSSSSFSKMLHIIMCINRLHTPEKSFPDLRKHNFSHCRATVPLLLTRGLRETRQCTSAAWKTHPNDGRGMMGRPACAGISLVATVTAPHSPYRNRITNSNKFTCCRVPKVENIFFPTVGKCFFRQRLIRPQIHCTYEAKQTTAVGFLIL